MFTIILLLISLGAISVISLNYQVIMLTWHMDKKVCFGEVFGLFVSNFVVSALYPWLIFNYFAPHGQFTLTSYLLSGIGIAVIFNGIAGIVAMINYDIWDRGG